MADLISAALKIVIGLGIAVAVALQARRLRRAASEPISDEQCVACGSTAVEILAPGAYRCTACGYEGGSGIAEQKARVRREASAALSSDERRRHACLCLSEALGMLERADDNPMSRGAEDRLSWLSDIEGALVHARAQFERAVEYVGQPVVQTAHGRFDAGHWVQRLTAEGPQIKARDMVGATGRVPGGRLRQAKRLRNEVREALRQAVRAA